MMLTALSPANPAHTRVVLSFVVQSCLDFGSIDNDARLVAWKQGRGEWAVSLADGKPVGIAWYYAGELVWLEVLPAHQGQGHGTALLEWAAQRTPRLRICPTEQARGFYQRKGLCNG